MSLDFQPVQLATGSSDTEGRLVFSQGKLLAVLTRLSGQHGPDAGKWFLEANFKQPPTRFAPLFDDIETAAEWLESAG